MRPAPLIAQRSDFLVQADEQPVAPQFLLSSRTFAERHQPSAAAAVRLAQAEQAAGNREAAVKAAVDCLQILRRQPDTAIAFALVQVLIGCDQLDIATQAIAQVPSEDLRATLEARIAIQRGELERALALLDSAESFEALTDRGWLLLQAHRFPEAIHVLRRALSIGGPNATLLTNLGYAHAAVGAREKAIKETKQAQAILPTSELIGFNLVSYHLAADRPGEAMRELARLREFHPTRLRFDLAEAEIHLRVDDVDTAYSTLRRARTSALWATAEGTERSELTANLAFVEWRLGKTSRNKAQQIVVEKLERSEYRHLPIAGLLPPLMRPRDVAGELEQLINKLQETNPGADLYLLRTHLAFLRCDFREAAKQAAAWAEDEIFNAHAAAHATYLLTDASGEVDRAISIGRTGLQIAGSTQQLVNNVAYALAAAGRLKEARSLLPNDLGESVYLTATAALIDILSGDVDQGVAGYDRAHELARRRAAIQPELAYLVLLHKAIALRRAGRSEGEVEIDPPAEFRDNPGVVLAQQVAKRAGLPCAIAASDTVIQPR